MNGRSPNVRQQLHDRQPTDIVVCFAVKAELFHGAGRSQDPKRSLAMQHRFLRLFRSLPFDDSAAELAGRLRAQLAAQGRLIGPYDLQDRCHEDLRVYRHFFVDVIL